METIRTIELLRSTRILRKVLETCGDFLLHKLQRENICSHEGYGDTNCIDALEIIFIVFVGGLKEFEISGREETIQIAALLYSARKLSSVQET